MPDLAAEIVGAAVPSLKLAMAEFAPDGAWGEGPGYWAYATSYNVVMIAALESALGSDFGLPQAPGFSEMECKYELIPVLQSLYRKGVKICASVPLPYFTCPKLKLGEFIALSRLYDKILIHSPENLDLKYIARLIHLERRISKSDFLRVFTYLKKKIIYTGYVIRESFLKEDASLHKKPLITIHRGGGTTSPDIISSALQAAPLLSRKYQILCIAGPATDNQELKKFKNLMSSKKTVNPVILKKFVPDLCPYFRRSEICVGTGGSTVYELLYLKKKAIVIPYMGAPGRVRVDQLARAHILKDYAGAAIIDYQKLNSESLINEISRLNLDKKISHSVINKEWFRGAEVTARAILC